MSAPGRLPVLCELRSPVGLRARPVCVSLCGSSDHCVVGFEDGAVAAWRVRDFPAREDVTPAELGAAEIGPAWVVRELSGSDGDGCPVDALALLPPCLAHPSGAVAVAHGGVDADVVGVGGYVPRPARVAILDLDTGREIRLLTLPMSWPNGGVCPVARLVPAGAEGGVVAVSAARAYRVGEGASGFQGSFACLAAWSGASPVPVAVIPVGPQHNPALGPDPSARPSGAPGKPRARLPSAPILEPFAGLGSHVVPRVDGGEGVVVILRAAHVVLETSTGRVRACPMEWRLAQPAAPLGVALRPTRHVEFASEIIGERPTMDALRMEAAATAEDPSGASAASIAAEADRPAPAVATWSWGMAAAWDGCEPRARTWRFGTAATPDGFEEQPAASAALDACARGARRRVADLVPMPNLGRILALTRDVSVLHDVPRLFVTRAGEPSADPSGPRDDRDAKSDAAAADDVSADDVSADDVSASAPPISLPTDDSEPCPICLESPGAGGDDSDLLAYDLATNPFAAEERASRVVFAPCCRAAFCRGCLRDYLAAFPLRGCPHCRDVDAFLRGEDAAAAAADAAAPFREISLEFERDERRRRADRETAAETNDDAPPTNDAAVARSRPPSSLPAALSGDLSDDFLRPTKVDVAGPAGRREASDPPPADLSDDFLRGLAPRETSAAEDEMDARERTSPAAASFVGAARICEDPSLVRRDRRVVDADDVGGFLVALTKRGAVVFDAGEEALAALFRERR